MIHVHSSLGQKLWTVVEVAGKYLSLWMKMPKWRMPLIWPVPGLVAVGLVCLFTFAFWSMLWWNVTQFNIWRVLVILRSRMRSRCEFWPWKKSEPKRSCVMLGSQKRSWHSSLPVIPYSVGNCYPWKSKSKYYTSAHPVLCPLPPLLQHIYPVLCPLLAKAVWNLRGPTASSCTVIRDPPNTRVESWIIFFWS